MTSKAFTLIELLIVISIIIIFSGIIFVNYGTSSSFFALDRSSQRLAQDLRKLEEMSLGIRSGTGVTGYLMYFDKVGSPYGYSMYGDNGNNVYGSGDVLEQSFSLESGIKICNLKDNAADVNTISASVVAPNPKVYIEGVFPGHEASIILCIISDVTETRTVKINSSGRIDITNP